MRQAAFCLPLALLFLANVLPSTAQSEASAPEPASAGPAGAGEGAAAAEPAAAPAPQATVLYDVGRNLSLRCNIAAAAGPYVWSKNGTVVEELWDLKERYKLEEGGAVFTVSGRALEDDFGNYTCAVGGEAYTWEVRGRPHAKLPANSNVVEGQKLKLQCKVIGKPYPRVVWTYSNSTDEESEDNGTEVRAVFGARVQLQRSEQGVRDAELLLEPAARADAGRFACLVAAAGPGAPNAHNAHNAHTVLRVKDKYAALWPFLGICAEVLVLCAIILVYEKRRTKPELDDSDTDNHDQKKS